MNHSHRPFLVGIAGSSGSGKTFFLKSFLNHFSPQQVTLISQDDYYIPANTKTREENRRYNFDVPTAFDRSLFYQHIRDLFDGKTVFQKEYTFNNPKIIPKLLEINSAPLVVVEGLFIFHYQEVDELLDYRIFLDADEPIALQRRLQRDLIERGYDHDDVMYKWVNHVVPAYNEYLLPHRERCDLVINNNIDDPRIIQEFTNDIALELKKKII
ncbi:MAG: uridine kinase family protein [Sphingobacterium sp.]